MGFEKAYDSIKWDFLEGKMIRFNFCSKWRLWMKTCISSAASSILVNGNPTEEFKHDRRLRQGDPISLYLFLIVAEGLSLLISKVVSRGILTSMEAGKDKLQYPIYSMQTTPFLLVLVRSKMSKP